MKQIVLNMAMIIMAQKGVTSTLEVKNSLFDVFRGEGNPTGIGHAPLDPTFQTSQKEISDLMAELYVEQNWNRVMNTSGQHHYYEYSIPVQATAPLALPIVSAVPTPAPVNSFPSATPAAQPVANTKVPALNAANGANVAYIAGKPHLLVQGDDMAVIRKKCFQTFNPTQVGLIYDDIRRCSINHYNRKYAI